MPDFRRRRNDTLGKRLLIYGIRRIVFLAMLTVIVVIYVLVTHH